MRLSSLRAATLAALSLAVFAACHRTPAGAPSGPVPTTSPASPRPYASGEEVIAAMRARYEGKWYSTLTFKQKTSRLQTNGTWNVQTWDEAIHIPGRLRIDFEPLTAANGVLYARDSQYVVTNGRVQRSAGVNALLLLGFDVFANPPARTALLLRREGIDLARVHTSTFDGRPMIVVGATVGDLKRKQFWVDAEHLYFVRLLERDPRDSTKMQDIRFVNYRREGDAWVAPRVEIHADGKLVFYEDYTDIHTNVPLDEALFDPARWKTAKHWLTQ
jgi:hypothetical protein